MESDYYEKTAELDQPGIQKSGFFTSPFTRQCQCKHYDAIGNVIVAISAEVNTSRQTSIVLLRPASLSMYLLSYKWFSLKQASNATGNSWLSRFLH